MKRKRYLSLCTAALAESNYINELGHVINNRADGTSLNTRESKREKCKYTYHVFSYYSKRYYFEAENSWHAWFNYPYQII